MYHFAFGKATVAAVKETERGYGGIIRQSLGVAKGFPWNVLSGSLEYNGLGALQLVTEVTKARLRQFQSMITSSAAADYSVAMAMVNLAQRWCGSSTPVSMLGTDELHLFEPLGAAAPQAAHMFHQLRKLGYKAAVGWVVRPPSSRRRDDLRRLHAEGWRHWPYRGGDSATEALAAGARGDVGVRAVPRGRRHAARPLHVQPRGARAPV